MFRFHFKRGLTLDLSGKSWSVIRRLKNGAIQLESEEGELRNESESTILEWCLTGKVRIDLKSIFEKDAKPFVARDLVSYPKELQERALRRHEYLQRLAVANGHIIFTKKVLAPKIAIIAKEINDKNPPSTESIRRWYGKYKYGKSLTSLVDQWEHKGRTMKWSKDIQLIVDSAIDKVLLNPQKYPAKTVCEEVERNVAELNKGKPAYLHERAPSRSTIYRYINSLEAYDVAPCAGR